MESNIKVKINYSVLLTLTEIEARALDAITGYSFKDFIKVFKKSMGESYIRGHEAGAESLFNNVRKQLGPSLNEVKKSRQNIGLAIKGEHHRIE